MTAPSIAQIRELWICASSKAGFDAAAQITAWCFAQQFEMRCLMFLNKLRLNPRVRCNGQTRKCISKKSK